MKSKQWVRQGHRWISVMFIAFSGVIFAVLRLGHVPTPWLYYLPLLPLALLAYARSSRIARLYPAVRS